LLNKWRKVSREVFNITGLKIIPVIFFLLFIAFNACAQNVNTKIFTLKNPPLAGIYSGQKETINIFEGSMGSGLCYIPGTDNEFYMLTDRGPNVDATEENYGKTTILFPIPNYTPKIFRVKLEGDSITILETILIRRPDGSNTTGLPNPIGHGSTGEFAWSNRDGDLITPDPWGLDCEGISLGHSNDFWICEEYGTSVCNVDMATGKIINRYWPFPAESNCIPIDTIFSRRRPNRGFEGIAVAPNGKVYALLQSPLWNPNSSAGDSSSIHRLLEIDTVTNQTKMFAYIHEPPSPNYKNKDWKIGDMCAINNEEFFVLEHAKRNDEFAVRIYKINISSASTIKEEIIGGRYIEQWRDSVGLSEVGITPVQKVLFLDLMSPAVGWNPSLEKPEGLTIINDSTIAVSNDNDLSIHSPKSNGEITDIRQSTYIYLIYLSGYMKIKNWIRQ
jgi:hypothetical protein